MESTVVAAATATNSPTNPVTQGKAPTAPACSSRYPAHRARRSWQRTSRGQMEATWSILPSFTCMVLLTVNISFIVAFTFARFSHGLGELGMQRMAAYLLQFNPCVSLIKRARALRWL